MLRIGNSYYCSLPSLSFKCSSALSPWPPLPSFLRCWSWEAATTTIPPAIVGRFRDRSLVTLMTPDRMSASELDWDDILMTLMMIIITIVVLTMIHLMILKKVLAWLFLSTSLKMMMMMMMTGLIEVRIGWCWWWECQHCAGCSLSTDFRLEGSWSGWEGIHCNCVFVLVWLYLSTVS